MPVALLFCVTLSCTTTIVPLELMARPAAEIPRPVLRKGGRMMRQLHAGLRWMTILLVCVAGRASAQSTATLQGNVTDTQSAVMPGVSVTLLHQATGIERAAVTDAAGQYVAASLPPGHYKVTAHLD